MLADAPLVWSPLVWSGDDMTAFVGCFHVEITVATAEITLTAAVADMTVEACQD
jgi:hypothetical protein